MNAVNVQMDINIYVLSLIVIVYLGAIAFFSYLGYRQTANARDFVLGGSNINPYVMALSYGAAFISTSAIIGFGGVAANLGMSLVWLAAANIIFGIFIAFAVLGKRVRHIGLQLQAHTFAEFLAKRVNSPFIQVWTGLVLFLTMPLYAAAVLIGASRIMEGLLGIPYDVALAVFSILVAAYVLFGGLKGVMYTDAMQGTLMLVGMIILLYFSYSNLGGVVEAHRELTAMAAKVPEALQAIGHRGWTASPEFASPLWWTIYSSLVLGVGIGVIAQPHLAVRCLTVKNNSDLNRAVLVGAIFILVTVGTPYMVGALSNLYFFRETGQFAVAAAGGNPDSVVPLYIKVATPLWFSYFFMLVILSAAISTLCSLFHANGIFLGRDVYETLVKGRAKSGQEKRKLDSILISRLGIVVAILVTVFLAKELPINIIARATAIFFGITAAGFLAPFLLSLYWQRLTRVGAVAGILSGLAVSFFGFIFLHVKESAVFGLAQWVSGKAALIDGQMMFVDPLVYAFPLSLLVTVVVSLRTRVDDPVFVAQLFSRIKRKT